MDMKKAKECVHCHKARGFGEEFNKYGFCTTCKAKLSNQIKTLLDIVILACDNIVQGKEEYTLSQTQELTSKISLLEQLRLSAPFFKSSTEPYLIIINNYAVTRWQNGTMMAELPTPPPITLTAEGMYLWAKNNEYYSAVSDNWSLKHFKIIEQSLMPEENVLVTFHGFKIVTLHGSKNVKSTSRHDNCYAFAITNKRVVMGQKQLIGEKLHSVYLDNINDISLSTGMVRGSITFDTIKETFSVQVPATSAKSLNSKIHEAIEGLKNTSNSNVVPTNTPSLTSDADELLKFKQLLDTGVINQDEFNVKKRQLLGM